MAETFPVVLRGYDKEKVERSIAEYEESGRLMREQIKAYDGRILKLEAELEKAKAAQSAAPSKDSFASLGANAQQLLASAEQTSTELLARAKQDAQTIKTSAHEQSETLINNAKLRPPALWTMPKGKLRQRFHKRRLRPTPR